MDLRKYDIDLPRIVSLTFYKVLLVANNVHLYNMWNFSIYRLLAVSKPLVQGLIWYLQNAINTK